MVTRSYRWFFTMAMCFCTMSVFATPVARVAPTARAGPIPSQAPLVIQMTDVVTLRYIAPRLVALIDGTSAPIMLLRTYSKSHRSRAENVIVQPTKWPNGIASNYSVEYCAHLRPAYIVRT